MRAILGVGFTVVCTIAALTRPSDEGWQSIFNGRDLTEWTPKIRYEKLGEDAKKTFRVEDGLLKVRYDNYEQFNEAFGHLFYNEVLSHYKLRLEYRFVGTQCPGGPGWAKANSGIMFQGQDPKTMTIDQDFPVSAEAQLLGGLGSGKRPTNNLCTPGTHVVYEGKLYTPHCLNSRSKTYDGEQWVTAEVEVHGAGKVIHRVNGEVVLEYEQVQYDVTDQNVKNLPPGDRPLLISAGTISLQSESHPVDFRKIELMKLPVGSSQD